MQPFLPWLSRFRLQVVNLAKQIATEASTDKLFYGDVSLLSIVKSIASVSSLHKSMCGLFIFLLFIGRPTLILCQFYVITFWISLVYRAEKRQKQNFKKLTGPWVKPDNRNTNSQWVRFGFWLERVITRNKEQRILTFVESPIRPPNSNKLR